VLKAKTIFGIVCYIVHASLTPSAAPYLCSVIASDKRHAQKNNDAVLLPDIPFCHCSILTALKMPC
jgi:hypothetical protein